MSVKRGGYQQLTDIIEDGPKRVRKPTTIGGILANLFRVIMFDLPITPGRMNALSNYYIDHVIKNTVKTKAAKLSIISNLNKELSRDELTWKKFIDGLIFLRFEGVLAITLDGKSAISPEPMSHKVYIDLSDKITDSDIKDGSTYRKLSSIITDGRTRTISSYRGDKGKVIVNYSNSEELLSNLFRTIMFDLNINEEVIEVLLKLYVKDPINQIDIDNSTVVNNVISNLNKELSRNELSWKKFIDGLRLLRFEDIVTVTVEGMSKIWGHRTKHSSSRVKFKMLLTPMKDDKRIMDLIAK